MQQLLLPSPDLPQPASVAAVEVPEAVDDGREVDAIVEDQSPLCWYI